MMQEPGLRMTGSRMKAAPMKAMILAAGLGTRLRPLTDSRPKALVELGGRTLLEIALIRLRHFGIAEVIVNVHHFADQVVEYLQAHDNFGMRIEISREDGLLLDTGGGLLKAADFFLRDAASAGDGADDAERPFLLHNVDVLSAIDLGEMLEFHRRHGALATLAVQRRKSSRTLLFDAQGRLCGRRTAGLPDEIVCAAPQVEAWAFAGIHVLSPRIFGLLRAGLLRAGLLRAGLMCAGVMRADGAQPEQAFPIVPEYLCLAEAGEKIVGFPADGYYWRDLGTPASLQQAAEDIERGLVEA
jgi:NDP-sugar pyrophosphorylase family protein